jgi:dihydroorotate dehydrogenase electron transfer subunit
LKNPGSVSELVNTLTVFRNEALGGGEPAGGIHALHLSLPRAGSPAEKIFSGYSAGQYAMLRPESWGLEFTWARPLSIGEVTGEAVFFFQVAGRGTGRLVRLAPGEKVQVVGPLGTGFALEPDKPALLLAGGIGLAPFVGYARQHPEKRNLKLLFGHRQALASYPFAALADKIEAESHQEKNPEDLRAFLNRVEEHIAAYAAKGNGRGLVLACGPLPFLRAVRELSLRHRARTQLSLEARMACGVGACLGCVIQPLLDGAAGGNKSAQPVPERMHQALPVPCCTCGPVFWADSIMI